MTNKDLMNVSQMNQTASEILSFVSERQRNTVYTAFSGLRADMKKKFGHEVNRKDFDDAFRELQKIGAGKLECSKRGVCLGFHWTIPIRQIGTILKNKDQVGQAVDALVVAKENQAAQKAAVKPKNVTVVILRRGGTPKTIQVSENRLRELDL